MSCINSQTQNIHVRSKWNSNSIYIIYYILIIEIMISADK